ncbi:DUF6542 domain-containing protein [Jatrophihabitans endophyticus]|uniref:DUF6542 domain-containing protein n=1 Tax=Jatrophihabitans endophyticus TaxID=1206085 RepID=UPI0019E4AA0B|nr:DUF6542 domain-containing protein [Jatrophihabitans endophyticus]MBE7189799.1 hypothetical protein [Jatrophihabitans endophyticus]
MAERFTPTRGGSSTPDDGWGPSTATYSSSAARGGPDRGRSGPSGRSTPADRTTVASASRAAASRTSDPRTTVHRPPSQGDPWTPAGPASREQQRANKLMERQLREMREVNRPRERGLRWWAALIVLIVIAVIGGLIDTVGTTAARGGFNVGIVVASIVAILIVKRSHMFPIVIAPPIVYSLAAIFQLYLRSSGLHDKKVVLDAAANYLVYGFPAIAAATAAVLIIAGARMILRK